MRAQPVIHRKKLFGGRMTAEDVHQKYAFPPHAKCACGARPMTRAIVMIELEEAKKRMPQLDGVMLFEPQLFLSQIVQIKETDTTRPYLRISIAYACKMHRRELERQLAKAPSHCIVEFNHGPGTDKVVTSGRG